MSTKQKEKLFQCYTTRAHTEIKIKSKAINDEEGHYAICHTLNFTLNFSPTST